ncbi:MAG TPA: AraC family transcriptional regulator [Microscillaceae bacterium]|nr:AraC family transcriptional regulator [Microscillaceae bacterium]
MEEKNSKERVIHQKSVSQIHEYLGFEKPTHPLITILDTAKMSYGEDFIGVKIISDLYCIALKDGSCGLDYGRNHYDFSEGVLIFTGPGQVYSVRKAQELNEINGWMIYFHPDLIRNTPLGSRIDQYSFFGYDVHEALHLSDQEQSIITNCVGLIQSEIKERIDGHSQQVLASNIELLLNYCLRYYERQFNTRAAQHQDIVSKVESLLKSYYEQEQLVEAGPPSLDYLADNVALSPYYLSDLLKKETGRTAKDHINDFLISKAKNLLLRSEDSISGIAFNLGFNYPHYFSRLFKNKTGMTPQEYRQLN